MLDASVLEPATGSAQALLRVRLDRVSGRRVLVEGFRVRITAATRAVVRRRGSGGGDHRDPGTAPAKEAGTP